MNALESASLEELVEELQKRATGLALVVVVPSDGGGGRQINITDRVKGDPFAIFGYIRSLETTAKHHYRMTVGRDML